MRPLRYGRVILVALMAGLLAGCVETTSWTREEAESVTMRTFSGVSQQEVVAAAEEALRRSDPDGFQFSYASNGFTARRTRLAYLVIAAVNLDYRFVFETEQRGSQVVTRLNIFDATTGTTPSPVITPGASSVGWGATTTAAGTVPWQQAGAYQLFYQRLDYALGRRDAWPACPRGVSVDPLCAGERS